MLAGTLAERFSMRVYVNIAVYVPNGVLINFLRFPQRITKYKPSHGETPIQGFTILVIYKILIKSKHSLFIRIIVLHIALLFQYK